MVAAAVPTIHNFRLIGRSLARDGATPNQSLVEECYMNFTNSYRQVAAAALSVAASVFFVACTGQTSGLLSPSGGSTGSLAAKDDGLKGVICHATGSSGNPYVGVIVGLDSSTIDPNNPIFSNNGHLDFNGSTLSGHEHDIYIGPNPPLEKQDCDKLPPPK
jgi:hypothetical protein